MTTVPDDNSTNTFRSNNSARKLFPQNLRQKKVLGLYRVGRISGGIFSRQSFARRMRSEETKCTQNEWLQNNSLDSYQVPHGSRFSSFYQLSIPARSSLDLESRLSALSEYPWSHCICTPYWTTNAIAISAKNFMCTLRSLDVVPLKCKNLVVILLMHCWR